MTSYPIDSTDAREQREREAEESTQAASAEVYHQEHCRNGWLGETEDGMPIACTRCRPWLLELDCRTCNVTRVRCTEQVTRGRGRCCPDCDHELNRGDTA